MVQIPFPGGLKIILGACTCGGKRIAAWPCHIGSAFSFLLSGKCTRPLAIKEDLGSCRTWVAYVCVEWLISVTLLGSFCSTYLSLAYYWVTGKGRTRFYIGNMLRLSNEAVLPCTYCKAKPKTQPHRIKRKYHIYSEISSLVSSHTAAASLL